MRIYLHYNYVLPTIHSPRENILLTIMLYLGPGHASISIAFERVHLPELCPWQLFTQSSKLLLLLH